MVNKPCPECGEPMEHVCSWVCVDICWPCAWKKRPGFPRPRITRIALEQKVCPFCKARGDMG